MGLFDLFSKKEKTYTDEVCVKKESDFSDFKRVTDFIYEKSGITDLDKRALTASRLQQFAISEDVYTTDEFYKAMKNKDSFYQEIMNIATVNETFFLREIKELHWLVEHIKSCSKNFKILCIPSSSGEEIYSILILLLEAGVDLKRVQITGYDINSKAIKNAIKGEYDEHSLHKLQTQTRDKYFNKNAENHYEIIPSIKAHTRFQQNNIFNLASENKQYDIVLSRNMFIYFDDEKRKKALDVIVSLLQHNGIYIKGHADYIKPHPKLESIAFGIYLNRP